MKKCILLGVLILTGSLLLSGCEQSKDKAIKSAQEKITSVTDNTVGIKFYDMRYSANENGTSCVFGKYRTDQMRETRFVLIVDKNFKVLEPITIEDHRYPGVQDFIWESPCG
ncbi:hypothetical protein [Serratia liquefaciens]|uniref:hypothetical protein n=1 Tax=Serratia liquefaciens TaxID=614 RepID=UPI0023618E90|nr:hypothetical protein [Serratia liquefaciens]